MCSALQLDLIRFFVFQDGGDFENCTISLEDMTVLIETIIGPRGGVTSVVQMSLAFRSYARCKSFGDSEGFSTEQVDLLWRAALDARQGMPGFVSALQFVVPDPPKIETVIVNAPTRKASSNLARKSLRMWDTWSTTPVSTCKSVLKGEVSLHVRELKLKSQLIIDVGRLFYAIGVQSPRFCEMYGSDKDNLRTPCLAEVNLLNISFFVSSKGKPIQACTVAGYVRDVTHFLEWIKSINSVISVISCFRVAAYINDQRPLGKTVPIRRLHALRWLEGVTKISLHTEDSLVRAQIGEQGIARPPKRARCPDLETVIALEKACTDKDTPVVAVIFIGMILCLLHGVLRWSDFQRSTDMQLGVDLLYARSVMKKRNQLVPWVASRFGFTGLDWGAKWLTVLQAHDMPGIDFVLLAPEGWHSFLEVPCSYSRALNTMRLVLIRFTGMSIDIAVLMTLHSWRHWYATATRQLQLPDDQQTAVGHWSKGSDMPATYDALNNSLEIAAKKQILRAVLRGWNIVPAGMFPNVVNESEGASSNDVPARACVMTPISLEHPCLACTHAEDFFLYQEGKQETRHTFVPGRCHVAKAMSTRDQDLWNVIDEVEAAPLRQVVDERSLKIHLYHQGLHTVCALLRCGTPKNPRPVVAFSLDTTEFDLADNVIRVCQKCYTTTTCERFENAVNVMPFHEIPHASSESSVDSNIESEGVSSVDDSVVL